MNTSNPHFKQYQRSAYELGQLLRGLPQDLDLTSGAEAKDKRMQMEAAEQHAGNYNDILLDGLESLGRILFVAGETEAWEVEQRDVSRIGSLISQLSIQLQFLDEFRTTVNDRITEADKKGARK